jgi:hypothetical protein
MGRLILFIAVAFLLAGTGYAYDWRADGERLHYKVSYGWFSAGEAELLYQPASAASYTIVARAWVDLPFADLRERLRVEGTHHINPGPFLPDVYTQVQAENDFRADKATTFDWKKRQAAYDNRLDAAPAEIFDLAEQSRDVLSALYYLRQAVSAQGDVAPLPVVSLHRRYMMYVDVAEPSLVKIGDKKVPVRRVVPRLEPVGHKKRSSIKWTIWMTDDAARLPVKIDAVTKFGSFHARLTRYGAAETASLAPASLPEQGGLPQ